VINLKFDILKMKCDR